jgi:hypothetical protein
MEGGREGWKLQRFPTTMSLRPTRNGNVVSRPGDQVLISSLNISEVLKGSV